MPYVKNWLHCVWGTKNRIHFLQDGNKYQIINHIRSIAKTKGIYIDFLNGYYEHLHCLLLLDCDQTLSKVMQLIKGESSYWINKNKLVKSNFEWADEYYAVSISESHVKRVREYIKNQEEHHKIKTWEEEYSEFLIQYGFSTIKG
jgi:REP element-mobilizing transposase RayT